MTEGMQGLVNEAKKSKFSTIGPGLSDEDVVSVWDNVSGFIEKHMAQQKGVNIPGLGTFSFSQKKLDVGNNKYILIQRPVFLLSEKFAQTHGLNYTKFHTTGQIPVVQLNFSALSFESPFDRDTVEACVKEVLLALARSIGAKRNVEFTFAGIGRLQIRESKVKMKFYKEFLNMMDGSGKLVDALKNRPGTVDSVMSDRSPTRANSANTLVLPRITQGTMGLTVEGDGQAALRRSLMPTINEDGDALDAGDRGAGEPAAGPDNFEGEEFQCGGEMPERELQDIRVDVDEEPKKPSPPPGLPPSRAGSRVAVPMAQASGINFTDDLLPSPSPKGMRGQSAMSKSSPTPLLLKRALSPITTPRPVMQNQDLEFNRSKSLDRISFDKMQSPLALEKFPTPPTSAPSPRVKMASPLEQYNMMMPSPPGTASSCGHANAGQELCYLCHQRDRRNIPVSFTEDRRRRELEEDRLLQQYQHMKDTEGILKEQENVLGKRHDNQKVAAFNLGVSEAIKSKKGARPTDFHTSYIFQKRPLTPPRFIKQNTYYKDLAGQVTGKEDVGKKRKADEEFLERLEQVQLAEDLAAQREQYLKDKGEQQEMYKRALSAQLRFKPLPIPARVPDSSDPVFGKHDMTNEAMAERRRRAHELYQEQLGTVEQRKREAILKRLGDQKEEEDMLKRTKKELVMDRADRYERMFGNRKGLESDWFRATDGKKCREHDDKMRARSPGCLLHEQCDKYNRCGQCKRRLGNCGESNIWRESRYIPGSRLMV